MIVEIQGEGQDHQDLTGNVVEVIVPDHEVVIGEVGVVEEDPDPENVKNVKKDVKERKKDFHPSKKGIYQVIIIKSYKNN